MDRIADRTLDHQSVIPLYHQLKEIIKDKIESGQWKTGDLVPSENQLQQEFKISRNTVKKALDDLVQDGLLHRLQGKGTFVSLPKFEHNLSGFYSFSKVLQAKGLNPKDIILSVERKKVQSSIAKHLQIEEDSYVFELRRLRCSNDEPMIMENSYIPEKLAQRLSKEKLEGNSLYDFLHEEYGITVTRAKETFEPILIRNYESRYLQVKEGSPALLLDRIAYDMNGNPVEFCRSVFRGDRCRFYTDLL